MDMKYNDAILQQNIPEFVNLFISTNFCDDFGYSKLWNKEVEKWLSLGDPFLKKIFSEGKLLYG